MWYRTGFNEVLAAVIDALKKAGYIGADTAVQVKRIRVRKDPGRRSSRIVTATITVYGKPQTVIATVTRVYPWPWPFGRPSLYVAGIALQNSQGICLRASADCSARKVVTGEVLVGSTSDGVFTPHEHITLTSQVKRVTTVEPTRIR